MSEVSDYYRPETEEPDPKSKPSYLQHISYRLKLDEEFRADSDSGMLSTSELRDLAEKIIFAEYKIQSDNESLTRFIREDSIFEGKQGSYSFLSTDKSWQQMSKPQISEIISVVLKFQLIKKEEIDEDDLTEPHISESSGAIYLPLYKSIWENLPDPSYSADQISLVESDYEDKKGVERRTDKIKAKELFDKVNYINTFSEEEWDALKPEERTEITKESTTVPEFQRDNIMWKLDDRALMIDSMLRNIPMPAIIIGKTKAREKEDPWQIIDGQQRLTTIMGFFDSTSDKYFPINDDVYYHNLPQWAKEKIESYEFVIEEVIANSENDLSRLYDRYNTAGARMSPPQIRVAKFHEISALHHYLLAMAGGPYLLDRNQARKRLQINTDIDHFAGRASALRGALPKTSQPLPYERTQLRKVTERVYDLWCRIIAYCIYQELRGEQPKQIIENKKHEWPEYPTAKVAINSVFTECRNGIRAGKLASKLDYITRECANLFGDYAFSSVKLDEEQTILTGKDCYVPKKSVHGWSAQVQCASLWKLGDLDMSILAQNPDTIQSEWEKFCANNIAIARQNSSSIWGVQEKWTERLVEILTEIKSKNLADEDSPKRKKLLEEIDIAMEAPEFLDHTKRLWKTAKPREEYEFLINELEKRI